MSAIVLRCDGGDRRMTRSAALAKGRGRGRRGARRNAATARRAAGMVRRAIRWPLLLRRRSVRLLLLVGGVLFALLELRQAPILQPVAEPYQRQAYPHWQDLDGNCRDTRAEVLARDSLVPVTWEPGGCQVQSGLWRDRWSGAEIRDPRALDIDHLVPLAEAHRSGADRWTTAQRRAFANDLTDRPAALVAVSTASNRSKADRDPVDWMPSDWHAWCAYGHDWRFVKRRWQLREDWLERHWLDGLEGLCGN